MIKVRSFILILLGTIIYSAKAATSVWDGYSDSYDWYTSDSDVIFHIKTAADFVGFAKCFSKGNNPYGNFAGCTIKLENDIDLNGHEWTPIGVLRNNMPFSEFAGTFDGNNHTIKGLSITKYTDHQSMIVAGLFGICPFAKGFSVKNLKVEGNISLSNLNPSNGCGIYVGGIIGYTVTAEAIENCQTNVNIDVEMKKGYSSTVYCGGAIGYILNSQRTEACKNCYSKGSINITLNQSNEARVGGLVGYLVCKNAIVSSCVSDCEITVSNGESSVVGGLFGSTDCISVDNSLYRGIVSLDYPKNGLVGGIVGSVFGSNTFNSCIMTGQVNRAYGNAFLSAISGTSSSSVVANNCYFLSGISNYTSYGTKISDTELKSGNPLEGFDESIWYFKKGDYPILQFMRPTYTISVPSEKGRIGFCVKEGESAMIQMDADDGWELKAFYLDSEDYTSNVSNGRYTFSSVTKNHLISAVFEKFPSGMRSMEGANPPQIRIKDRNSVEIGNITNTTGIKVFDLAGNMILSETTSSAITLNLNNGLYLIKVGEKTFKVSL